MNRCFFSGQEPQITSHSFMYRCIKLWVVDDSDVDAAKKREICSKFLLLKQWSCLWGTVRLNWVQRLVQLDISPWAPFLFLHQFTCVDLTLDLTSVVKKKIRVSWVKGWPPRAKLHWKRAPIEEINQWQTWAGFGVRHIVRLTLELVQVINPFHASTVTLT